MDPNDDLRLTRHDDSPALAAAGVALLLLLAFVLAGVAALVAGSLLGKTVAPFGPAANGDIAYASGGDIFTADPVPTGASTALLAGDATDSWPVYSRDGLQLAFTRLLPGEGPALFVASAAGTDPRKVADLENAEVRYAFTPDGRGLLLVGNDQAFIASVDGRGPRPVLTGEHVKEAVIRPDGSEILYVAEGPTGTGIYATGLDGDAGQARTIVAPTVAAVGWIRPSPDGTRIAYSEGEDDPGRNTYRVHVANADGSDNRTLPMPEGATAIR